jgi:hypothetical protein
VEASAAPTFGSTAAFFLPLKEKQFILTCVGSLATDSAARLLDPLLDPLLDTLVNSPLDELRDPRMGTVELALDWAIEEAGPPVDSRAASRECRLMLTDGDRL